MNASAAASAYGDPGKPGILFLHGIRLGREIWKQHATALSWRYHVVTLDLPGHGSLYDMPFTIENVTALVDDAVATLFNGKPPLIAGYSLGGYVAMRYAAQHPERTAAMLLAGCTVDLEGWKWWPYGASAALTMHLPEAWRSAMLHAALYLSLPRYWLEVVERIPFDPDVFARTSEIARTSHHAIDEIAGYRKPVLFVNGEYDLAFRADERRFLHRLPQARLRIMHGVDHTAPMRRVEEFTGIVDEFARKVYPPA